MRTESPGSTEKFEYAVEHFSAPEVQPGRNEVSIEDELCELVPSETLPEVMALLEKEAERLAFGYAAQTLRRIFGLASTRSTTGAALAHCFGFGEEASLNELAAQFSSAKQSIGNTKARLMRILHPLVPGARAPKRTPCMRPDQPGEWLSRVEAAKFGRVSNSRIAHATKTGELHPIECGHQYWYTEEEIEQWSDRYHQEESTKKERLRAWRSDRQARAEERRQAAQAATGMEQPPACTAANAPDSTATTTEPSRVMAEA